MNGLNVEFAEQRGISLNTLQRYCTTADHWGMECIAFENEKGGYSLRSFYTCYRRGPIGVSIPLTNCPTAIVSLRLSVNAEMTIFAKAIYLYICFLVYYVRRPTVEIRGAVFLYRPIHHRIPITSQRYELDTMERL